MKKILIFLTAILIGVNVSAQRHYIYFPTNDMEVKKNNYYWYNYTMHSFLYSESFHLDTLNLCRVRRNKIKSVTIYELFGAADSVEITKTEYDSLGLTPYMKTQFSEEGVARINCDYFLPPENPPHKVIRKKSSRTREKWKTDSAGYIIEYKKVTTGLFYKWLLGLEGIYDQKVIYEYDSLHLSVTETIYPARKMSFKKAVPASNSRYVYRIDSKGNLLSESWYELNENGEMVFSRGYTYHYEYY
jgi:hypothetical protein